MRTRPQARSRRQRLQSRSAGSVTRFSEILGSSKPGYASLRHGWSFCKLGHDDPFPPMAAGSRRKAAANRCENVNAIEVPLVKAPETSTRSVAASAKDHRGVLM